MSIYDKSSLVLIPSGTKTGKVYSQKPVNGDGDFTFSRSTAATRVNADGNIEKETQNLLVQSNNFATTWGRSNTSVTGGQSSYDGSSDAWLLSKSAASGQIGQNTTSSGVNTFSVYAKANVSPYVRLTIFEGGYSANGTAYFDLQNGVLGTTNAIDSSIENVGNGWYRCSVTFNTSNQKVYIYPADGDNDTSGTSGSIYIQDAQLEQGLVARGYIETTTTAVEGGITDNVPRLDYTDTSCPALLLEPQRTNQILYSEYQSGGGFALGPNITWNGFVESPEGVSNASRFTSNVQGFSYVAAQGVVIPSGDFTFSMWVRGVSGTFLNRPLNIAGLSGTSLVYMNETPVAGEDWKLVYGAGNNTGSAVTKTITLPFYDQPVGSVLEMYGFQLEAGSYATSYIPTYGTSVTRNQDFCLKTGISSLIGQTEGTLFAEFDIPSKTENGDIIAVNNGSSANGFFVSYRSSGVVQLIVRTSSSNALIFQRLGAYAIGKNKIAVAYKNGDFAISLNGTAAQVDTSTITMPSSISDFRLFGGQLYAQTLPIQYAQTLLFKTRLSNEELADLTTL